MRQLYIKTFTKTLMGLMICLFSHTMVAQNLNGSHFKPYQNKWKMYAVDQAGDETLVRIWTDYAQSIELEGKTYISRIQELYSPEMHLLDLWTNLFEKNSLLPYRASQFRTAGSYQYLEFEGKQVSSTSKAPNEAPVKKEMTFEQTPYDWTLYGILLSGVEFKEGSKTKLPVYLPQSPDGLGELIVTVEAQEDIIDDSGKKYSTWKVSTNLGLTFWLTKEAPYVIQLILDGQNGAYNIWRMY